MAEKTIKVDLAKSFNVAMRQLLEVSEEAVARLEKNGADEFVCSNYRQALQGLSYVVKYVRDFGGSSTTAGIEAKVAEILDSVQPERVRHAGAEREMNRQRAAEPKGKYKKKDGNEAT